MLEKTGITKILFLPISPIPGVFEILVRFPKFGINGLKVLCIIVEIRILALPVDPIHLR